MVPSCQDIRLLSSLPAAGTRPQWSMLTDPYSILGSQSTDQLGKPKNSKDSSDSPDLQTSLPNAPVQTSNAPQCQEQGFGISRDQQQQELGHFLAVPDSSQPRNTAWRYLSRLIPRLREEAPDPPCRASKTSLNPTRMHRGHPSSLRFPCPTLLQGAQGRADIDLGQLVQAQGL